MQGYDEPIPGPLFFRATSLGLTPTDEKGFICSKGEWKYIKEKIDAFFSIADREAIEEHNLAKQRQLEERHSFGRSESVPKKKRPGYIYLALSNTGHHKIGLSVNPEKRIQHFDTQMPIDVALIHTFPADDMYSAESELHSIFADKRVNGEWFLLSEDDVGWLCDIEGYDDGTFHANS